MIHFSLSVPCRPDLLVRAARHYEGAGQVLLRQALMSSQKFLSIGQGELPPLGEWQEVECPARLDFAGERCIKYCYTYSKLCKTICVSTLAAINLTINLL